MSEFFKDIPEIKFEGKDSTNPFAFKYYDAKRVIMGKTMEEHLPFAMAWWHNLCAAGVDMFGQATADNHLVKHLAQWSMPRQKLTQDLNS